MIRKLINEYSETKFNNFIYKHCESIRSIFISNGQFCYEEDLLYIYLNFYSIYNYLCNIGALVKQGIRPNLIVGQFINSNYKFNVPKHTGTGVKSISKNMKKFFRNIEMSEDKMTTRFNNLSTLVGKEDFFIDDNVTYNIYLDRRQASKVRIGNIIFYSTIPSIDAVVDFLNQIAISMNISYIPKDYSYFTISDKLEVMCYILGINKDDILGKSDNNELIINAIISDFSHILCLERRIMLSNLVRFAKRLLNSTKLLKWTRSHCNEEIKSYRNFLSDVNKQLIKDYYNNYKEYDKYVIENIPYDECNQLKLNIDLNLTEHPDLTAFKYLMEKYISWMDLPINNSLQVIYKTIVKYGLQAKIIYLREVLKNIAQKYDVYWKNCGFILLYNIECCLGYRKDKLKPAEMEKQYRKNFFNHNEVNSTRQKEFFKKWFKYAVNFRKLGGKSLRDIVSENDSRNAGQDIYINKHIFFDAQGACNRKIYDDKGRPHNMSKTQFFSSVPDIEKYFNKDYIPEKEKDVIVIKEELVKQRIVVNTGLDTYIPLAKIEYLLTRSFKGFDHCYGLMSRENKNLLHARFCRYLIHNKYASNKYLCLPLDYSSFDTTITFDLIVETIRSYASLSIYKQEILKQLNLFIKLMEDREVDFKQLDKRFKYSYGVLSGWKITNIVESLLNFVISFGVMGEMEQNLIDIITMGDDLVLVLDEPSMSDTQMGRMLHKVSDIYKRLGFEIHPIKNMIGYNCIEFLRNYYNNNICVSYPMRALISIIYQKPTAEIEYTNYSNYKASLDKLILKLGIFDKVTEVYSLMNISVNSNIREFGFTCCTHLNEFGVINRNIYEYRITNSKFIKNSQIFKYYLNIFGNQNEDIVYSYVKNNIFSKKVTMETIVPKTKKQIWESSHNVILFEKRLRFLSYFFKNINSVEVPDLRYNVGDYHINSILSMMMENRRSIDKNKLIQLINNYDRIGITKKTNMILGIYELNYRNYNLILKDMKFNAVYTFYNHALIAIISEKIRISMLYYKIYNRFKFLRSKNGFNEVINYILGTLYSVYNYIYIYTGRNTRVPIYLYID